MTWECSTRATAASAPSSWILTLQARPAERWEADRAAMVPLPPTAPPRLWQTSVRIGRDHYIRLDTCDYSVDQAAIGRIVRIEDAAARTCSRPVRTAYALCGLGLGLGSSHPLRPRSSLLPSTTHGTIP